MEIIRHTLADLQAFLAKNKDKATVDLVRIPNRNSQGVIVEDDTQWGEDKTSPQAAERILAELERDGIEADHDLQVSVSLVAGERVTRTGTESGYKTLEDAQTYIDSFK